MDRIIPCSAEVCFFNKTPTIPILLFETLILASTILLLTILHSHQKKSFANYLILMAGVLIFELFTAPLWNNERLGIYAYIYIDVSWILTIGWATLIMYVMFLVDQIKKGTREAVRFGWYLTVLTPLVLIFESVVVKLGIRSYAPEVYEVIKGQILPFLDIPVAGLYYIPVFLSLVIGFYKYWSFYISKKLLIPVRNTFLIRKVMLIFLSVFLFEFTVEPLVINAGLPQFLYVYRDINLLLTLIWVLIILVAIKTVDSLAPHYNLIKKFIGYMLIGGVVATPIEAWLIANGIRIYSPSATANFSGVHTILFNVPVEVIFAIPFYLALIIGFTKYWEFVIDNKL